MHSLSLLLYHLCYNIGNGAERRFLVMKQLYIADAFTTERFGGNPAGVVLLKAGEDYPADELMRKTAAELRYSETAFI